MTVEELRSKFPELECKVYGKPLVYLDNAATSLRPESVIDEWNLLSSSLNANIHRAVHFMAVKATDEFEKTRETVKSFINAPSIKNIVFTSGTTASINLVAYSFSEAFLQPGDEVIVGISEHHSNMVPWQLACKRHGASIKYLGLKDDILDASGLENLITERTKIIAVAEISNVLGLVNPIQEIIKISHSHGVPVLVDGAQGIVHGRPDVQKLDCDFYAFSGHKMYASTGVGVLYAKEKWLEAMPPFMAGGEMIGTVGKEETSFAPIPFKFEAGTQNFNSVPTLIPAIRLAEEIEKSNSLKENLQNIQTVINQRLTRIEGLKIFGNPESSLKIPLYSFSIDGIHHEDLALILDKMGFAVRSGQMCAELLMNECEVSGMLRISFAPYNTVAEAEAFVSALDKAVNMLR